MVPEEDLAWAAQIVESTKQSDGRAVKLRRAYARGEVRKYTGELAEELNGGVDDDPGHSTEELAGKDIDRGDRTPRRTHGGDAGRRGPSPQSSA